MTAPITHVSLPSPLVTSLLHTVLCRNPLKSFGFLLAHERGGVPADFLLGHDNVRNRPGWRDVFEREGQYFVDNHDAGFVAGPEDSLRIHREIRRRGMHEVAVFHTHHRHPGNFAGIDRDLHVSRFTDLWHLIISLRNPCLPQLRAFTATDAGVVELDVVTTRPREKP